MKLWTGGRSAPFQTEFAFPVCAPQFYDLLWLCLRAAAARGEVCTNLTNPTPRAGSDSSFSSMFPPVPSAGVRILTNPTPRGSETPHQKAGSRRKTFFSPVFFRLRCFLFLRVRVTDKQTGRSDMQNRIGSSGLAFCCCHFPFCAMSRVTAGAPRPCTRAKGP